jgi:hypothetical protein
VLMRWSFGTGKRRPFTCRSSFSIFHWFPARESSAFEDPLTNDESNFIQDN